jgi:hypothetical protein
MLGEILSAAEGIGAWDVKLHPFRIVTGADQVGRPAPQDRHRDGSTFVTSLPVLRNNLERGESSLHGDDDTLLLRSTLSRPGDQLLVGDRRLLHDVTPLRAVGPALLAYRDVLIVDFDRRPAWSAPSPPDPRPAGPARSTGPGLTTARSPGAVPSRSRRRRRRPPRSWPWARSAAPPARRRPPRAARPR